MPHHYVDGVAFFLCNRDYFSPPTECLVVQQVVVIPYLCKHLADNIPCMLLFSNYGKREMEHPCVVHPVECFKLFYVIYAF